MPLSRRQFDLGVNDEGERLMREAYEMLADRRDLAYSREEIREALLGRDLRSVAVDTISKHSLNDDEHLRRALAVLVGIGALEQREVRGTPYYAFLQEFDTGTWLSAKHTSPR